MSLSWVADLFSIAGAPLIIAGWIVLYREVSKHAEEMSMTTLKKWGIIVAFGISTLLWLLYLASYFGIIGRSSSPLPNERLFFETTQMSPIRNRHYLNEEVSLDGYEFINCTFENVTFAFNGLAPFNIVGPRPTGQTLRVRSESKILSHFMKFLREFKLVEPGVVVLPDFEHSQTH